MFVKYLSFLEIFLSKMFVKYLSFLGIFLVFNLKTKITNK